jgi:hypothetical protein
MMAYIEWNNKCLATASTLSGTSTLWGTSTLKTGA